MKVTKEGFQAWWGAHSCLRMSLSSISQNGPRHHRTHDLAYKPNQILHYPSWKERLPLNSKCCLSRVCLFPTTATYCLKIMSIIMLLGKDALGAKSSDPIRRENPSQGLFTTARNSTQELRKPVFVSPPVELRSVVRPKSMWCHIVFIVLRPFSVEPRDREWTQVTLGRSFFRERSDRSTSETVICRYRPKQTSKQHVGIRFCPFVDHRTIGSLSLPAGCWMLIAWPP